LKSLVELICFGLFFIISTVPLAQNVNALDIIISHGGTGEIELCIESDGYEDQCDDFDLSEWPNPLPYVLDVEDPDEGHDFQICYEVKGVDEKECNDFEFTGSADQSVDVQIPNINSTPDDSEPVNNDDFSLQGDDRSLNNASNTLGDSEPVNNDDFSLQGDDRILNNPSNTPATGLPAVPASPP
jgi:hypothetical protein